MFGKKKSEIKSLMQKGNPMHEAVQTIDCHEEKKATAVSSQRTLEEWLRYWGETYPYNIHSCSSFRTFV
jgi:hypothetical protein